jgi:membrane protein DedA with SNARE-associated domain
MKPFERLVKKYGAAAAFFAAATPMPDDIIFIPLGLAKYNAKRFFVATLAGKIVLSYIIVFISHYLGLSFIEPFLENVDDPTPVYIGILIFGAMMTGVVLLVLKLDWQRIMVKFAPWTLDDTLDDENNKDSKN